MNTQSCKIIINIFITMVKDNQKLTKSVKEEQNTLIFEWLVV